MSKISIIICTYNGEKYLEKVLKSILEQESFTEIIDYVIVVDNASTDSTKEIVKRFESENEKVRYEYEKRQGLAYARSHILNVESEWTLYIDDDNILLPEYLIHLQKFIKENKDVGTINSCSIATPDFDVTYDIHEKIKAVLPMLACTHANIESFENRNPSRLMNPFGAGLCLKTEYVKKFFENNELTNIGRTKNDLASGDDGEMASIVHKHGLKHGFNYFSGLLHMIPESRLEDDYIEKLIKGLEEGIYSFESKQNNYLIIRLKQLLKASLNIIKWKLYSCKKMSLTEEYYRKKILYLCGKDFFKLLWKDKLIRR